MFGVMRALRMTLRLLPRSLFLLQNSRVYVEMVIEMMVNARPSAIEVSEGGGGRRQERVL